MRGHQFVSYPLAALYPLVSLPGDVYLFVGGRFVKLYHSGDEITAEKYDSFILKKIQFLFINGEELDSFKIWSSSLKNKSFEESPFQFGDAGKQVAEIASDVRDEFL